MHEMGGMQIIEPNILIDSRSTLRVLCIPLGRAIRVLLAPARSVFKAVFRRSIHDVVEHLGGRHDLAPHIGVRLLERADA